MYFDQIIMVLSHHLLRNSYILYSKAIFFKFHSTEEILVSLLMPLFLLTTIKLKILFSSTFLSNLTTVYGSFNKIKRINGVFKK